MPPAGTEAVTPGTATRRMLGSMIPGGARPPRPARACNVGTTTRFHLQMGDQDSGRLSQGDTAGEWESQDPHWVCLSLRATWHLCSQQAAAGIRGLPCTSYVGLQKCSWVADLDLHTNLKEVTWEWVQSAQRLLWGQWSLRRSLPLLEPQTLVPVPLSWVPYLGKNSRQEPVWRDCMDKTRLGWSGRQINSISNKSLYWWASKC